MPAKKETSERSNFARHARGCRVCSHPECEQIEQDFVDWESPITIAKEFGIPNRASIYRHAHACGLLAKRARNLRAVLDRFLERAGDVDVTSSTIVQAVALYAKINSQGQLVRRDGSVNLNDLFAQMTPEELERYARDTKVPARFGRIVGATPNDETEGNNKA